ncbi:zinc finger, CCHC-type containing protein [Tanacetum coccineum]
MKMVRNGEHKCLEHEVPEEKIISEDEYANKNGGNDEQELEPAREYTPAGLALKTKYHLICDKIWANVLECCLNQLLKDVLKGLSSSFPNLVMTTDLSSSTALLTTLVQGHVDVVNLLLGADSNPAKIARNNDQTVLHTAARIAAGPSNLLARRVIDDLIDFSGETSVPKYMNFIYTVSFKSLAMVSFLLLDKLAEVDGSSRLQDRMNLVFSGVRSEDESFIGIMRDLCFGFRIRLNKNQWLIAELEALGQRGDALRSLDYLREMVARDSGMLSVLDNYWRVHLKTSRG